MYPSLRALMICAAIVAIVPFAILLQGLATGGASSVQSAGLERTVGEDLYRRGLYAEAIAWWTEQAARGDAAAARHLGVEYMDGKANVVRRDYQKARFYHLQAAKAGDARSMFDLGTIHENGLGVPANLIEGANWYEWAAKYGHPQGQYNIATFLEMGDGGRKDEVEAYMYYLLAGAQGVGGIAFDLKTNRVMSEDESPIQQLRRRLSAAQIAKATARARGFKALRGPMPI